MPTPALLQLLTHEAAHVAACRLLRLPVESIALDRAGGCVKIVPGFGVGYVERWLVAAYAGPRQDGVRIDPQDLDPTADGDRGTVAFLAQLLQLDAVRFLELETKLDTLRATDSYRRELDRACADLERLADW